MALFKICVYLWTVVAIVYLVLSLLNKKKTAVKEKPGSRLIYLLCLIIGMAFIFYEKFPYGYLADPIYKCSNTLSWTGIIITAMGISFSLWARFIIGANWSGVVMVKKDHELIQSGPYAIVRHPTYSGFIFALLGTVMVLNEWRGIIGFVILIVSFLWKISKEEKMLKAEFSGYIAYQKRTKKIIPFIY
jgi:protein-S-isoprenylcysteine O-methyltransferase Ste14